jgi:hypothetical protein
MIRKYFSGSFLFTIFALVIAIGIGQYYGGNAMAFTYFVSCIMLAILEVSVSLDNAVVNATILKDMDNLWRHRFLTWGMAIAVFGMRLVFPLAIVSIAGGVNPIDAVKIALLEPKRYEEILTSVHLQVMAFGGTFLFMVFSSHFIDHEKEEHWIPFVGHFLAKIGKHSTAKLFIPVVSVLVFSRFVHDPQTFLTSCVWGLVVYLMVDGLGDLFDVEDAAVTVARAGIASFLYLEVLDASFSFDGVIAAFAITNNFLIIMLGLSIGAMFVRSLTILLVETGTLDTLRYLEDGAFWGIGWLVATMFMSILHIELGEFAVAGGAAAAIAIAGIHSVIANKRDATAKVIQ